MTTIERLGVYNIPEILPLIHAKMQAFQSQFGIADLSFTQKPSFEQILTDIILSNPAYGAFENGVLKEFLVGYANIPAFKENELGVYIPAWGYIGSHETLPYLLELYTQISEDWLAKRNTNHICAYFPFQKELEQVLYRLGFGLVVIDALTMKPDISQSDRPLPQEFSIHALTRKEQEKFAQFAKGLLQYVQSSPTFLYSPEDPDDFSFEEFMGSNVQTFIVTKEDEIIGGIRGVIGESHLDILSHTRNMEINFAYIADRYRKLHLGAILLQTLMIWGQQHNVVRYTVDFESANIIGSQFWLSYFTPVCYNSIRKIDNRIIPSLR